jgi:predicted transcriptional regulator YheO
MARHVRENWAGGKSMKKALRRGSANQVPSRAEEILKYYEPVVDCIADLFGPSCEVVLHDVRRPTNSVVKIRNGDVTGRTLGSPLTNLGLEILQSRRFTRTTFGNYQTRTKDGRTLNSNAVMIRDEAGTIVGMLCINWDVTPVLAMKRNLATVYRNGSFAVESPSRDLKEHHASDVPTLIRSIIQDEVKKNGHHRHKMNKKEKRLHIVNSLYRRGVFNVRGAVQQVARALGISNVSVYKYLEEVRH